MPSASQHIAIVILEGLLWKANVLFNKLVLHSSLHITIFYPCRVTFILCSCLSISYIK